MTDYTKITDFAAKDALSTGNPAKIVNGTEHDNEFNAIETASETKANKNPAITATNVVVASATGDIADGGILAANLVSLATTNHFEKVTTNELVDNGNSGATKTITWDNGNIQAVLMTANCTFTFTAPTDGAAILRLRVAGGGSLYTTTWPATVFWASADSMDDAPINKFHWVDINYDGTNYWAVKHLSYGG